MAQPEAPVKKTVFIVTSAELGWDCIMGVFDPEFVTMEQLEKEFPQDGKSPYFIFEQTVKTNMDDYA